MESYSACLSVSGLDGKESSQAPSLTPTPLSALYPSRVEETEVVLSLEQTERHSRRHVQRGSPSQKDAPNPGDRLGMGLGWSWVGLCPQDALEKAQVPLSDPLGPV